MINLIWFLPAGESEESEFEMSLSGSDGDESKSSTDLLKAKLYKMVRTIIYIYFMLSDGISDLM